MQYVFDGTWMGLLTAVFEYFDRRQQGAELVSKNSFQPVMFDASFDVQTDPTRGMRVWQGLQKRIGAEDCRLLYWAFLSELPRAANTIFRIMVRVFSGQSDALKNYGDADALFIAQTAKKVSRERHRMKAFTRFEKANDGLFFASVEPDYNVLPLIGSFFQKRYADQEWLIYDKKRGYGLHYDKLQVSEVTMAFATDAGGDAAPGTAVYEPEEEKFKLLWQDYFRSTNIAARKNLKLHVQHVPKRYWKYLVEKQDAFF